MRTNNAKMGMTRMKNKTNDKKMRTSFMMEMEKTGKVKTQAVKKQNHEKHGKDQEKGVSCWSKDT